VVRRRLSGPAGIRQASDNVTALPIAWEASVRVRVVLAALTAMALGAAGGEPGTVGESAQARITTDPRLLGIGAHEVDYSFGVNHELHTWNLTVTGTIARASD
jgi:hypothetical protein